jgi:CheY-like chemotaxis protein
LKILVVDDNADTLDIVELYLYRDFEVFTAEHGYKGVEQALKTDPDLILTDIMMPGMDGVRMFNELRRHEKTASVPVVAMTSFLKKITRKSLLSIGFSDVVEKPVDRERLHSVIGRILSAGVDMRQDGADNETAS